MTNYSLDQLRADIETRYGALVSTSARAPSQPPSAHAAAAQGAAGRFAAEYAEIQAAQDVNGADLDGVIEPIEELLRIVAKDDGSAERLLSALPPDDPAFLLELFEQYARTTMPGEASPSQS